MILSTTGSLIGRGLEGNAMKKLIVLFITFLIFSFWKCDGQSVEDWENLKMDYAAYLKNSSVENVDKVCVVMTGITEKRNIATPEPDKPKSPHEVTWYMPPEGKAEGKTVDYMLANFKVLEKRVHGGNRPSIHLALKLREIHDGGEFGEDLDILLDSLIHSSPQLFLEGLKENGEVVKNPEDLDELISFMGALFADEVGQTQKEYASRIRDLQKVKQPELITLRDECIKILKAEIDKAS